MKNVLVAAFLAVLAGNAYATCPAALSGVYSGYMDTYNSDTKGNLNSLTLSVATIAVTPASITVISSAAANTNDGNVADDTASASVAYPYTYNRSTCSGVAGAGSTNPVYFVVSGNGSQLNVVLGSRQGSNALHAVKGQFNK